MLKNAIVKAFALAAVVGIAACAQPAEEEAVETTPAAETAAPAPALETPAPVTEPVVTDTALVPVDTTMPAAEAPAAPSN